MEVESTGATAASGSSNVGAATNLAENFDTFLTLLTTQLQNQDPLEPLDSSEFTQQLVQFSGVEQSIKTNDNLEAMLGLLNAAETASAVNYLGKFVEVDGNTTELADGTARWTYSLDDTATATSLNVTDSAGKVVFNTSGDTASGPHELVWDGTDNVGNPLPEGSYSLEVAAIDGGGNAVGTTVTTFGLVSGIETENGRPVLLVEGARVPVDNVKVVKDAPADEGEAS